MNLWWLIFVFMTNGHPSNIQLVSSMSEESVCRVAAKVYQENAPDAVQGYFSCLRLGGG